MYPFRKGHAGLSRTDAIQTNTPPSILQFPMLKTRWRAILGCLMLQYVHGIFTQLVYRRHVPSPEPLLDTGFELLPVLSATLTLEPFQALM